MYESHPYRKISLMLRCCSSNLKWIGSFSFSLPLPHTHIYHPGHPCPTILNVSFHILSLCQIPPLNQSTIRISFPVRRGRLFLRFNNIYYQIKWMTTQLYFFMLTLPSHEWWQLREASGFQVQVLISHSFHILQLDADSYFKPNIVSCTFSCAHCSTTVLSGRRRYTAVAHGSAPCFWRRSAGIESLIMLEQESYVDECCCVWC